MTDLLLKIDAEDLARVVPFACENDVRYYLNGVCIEPHENGAILIATNGHMLAAIQSPNSYAAEMTILGLDKRFTAEIRKVGLKRGSQGFVELRDAASYPEVVRMSPRTVTYVSPRRPAVVDGKYPNWRAIMPKDDDLADGMAGTYNASYLEAAAEAACLANGPKSRYNGMKVQHSKSKPVDSPLVVRTSDNRALVILIMPQRDSFSVDHPLPDWTRIPPAPVKPAEVVAAPPAEAVAA